jgi:membrane protease subunit HflK
MPWSDHSDDGGSKSGGKQGPWGAQPPGGSGGSGDGGGPADGGRDDRPSAPKRPTGGGGPRRPATPPTPDDLTIMLRRLRQRLEGEFAALNQPGAAPRAIIIGLAVVALLWLASGFYQVAPAEQGVVTTFGAYSRTASSGLNYHLPAPIERVEKVSVSALKATDVGARGADIDPESLMLTGDENIISVDFTVQWRIYDARKYLFNVKDPEDTIRAVAESAIREAVGKNQFQAILTTGRGAVQNETRDLMQKILDRYDSGVQVVEVQITQASPPKEVVPDFQAVASAGQSAQSAVNDANAYANKVVNEAKGSAAQITQAAAAYREQTVRDAEGEVSRFSQLDAEYRRAPAVTKQRLYLETMEKLLAHSNKVVIDAHGSTAPIILPPDVFKPRGPGEAPPVVVPPAPGGQP